MSVTRAVVNISTKFEVSATFRTELVGLKGQIASRMDGAIYSDNKRA